MPYKLWCMITPVIRQAKESGLLDEWNYGFRRHYEANQYEEQDNETDNRDQSG